MKDTSRGDTPPAALKFRAPYDPELDEKARALYERLSKQYTHIPAWGVLPEDMRGMYRYWAKHVKDDV